MPIPRAVAVVVDGPRVLVLKRHRRRATSAECRFCTEIGVQGPDCPGHRYAILPGGHVEDGETREEAALRELAEETTLRARIDRLLWTGLHFDRPASYFLMADITGTPELSGPEALRNGPDDHYELLWAGPEDFAGLNLRPVDIRTPLARLLENYL
ncbi:NUDIX domain-containing protein [Actinomadura parmotrematis]|uniref:NUDIX domain-containing protein n=1 Tax=Actinomadura parmotrematis TaxID=2864039 RepID=A0ABS7FQX3_9ACTN|nr:NUDIX domain-containing protein [Actinomadura parmotrematis]MBW8482711.1 NUDIX domain-containing protein [Actinomadura parmotrematis]